MIYENVVCTIAEDKWLIRKPTPNPLWHQESPFVAAPLLEVANSPWGKALMDAPTKHNHALIEMYNLMVDGAMKAANNITTIRTQWVKNKADLANGIQPGSAVQVNDQAPPGAKVIETLNTGDVPTEAVNMFNLMSQEFNASSLTNDLRSGVLPFRQVKATEVVEASQSITSTFQGIAKNIEENWILKVLEKSWMTIAQRMNDLDSDEMVSLLGAKRAAEIKNIAPEDRFAETVNGIRFKVNGISLILQKQSDFQKLTTLLQTVSASDVLLEAFLQKYDFTKLLDQVMRALDVDVTKVLQDGANEAGPGFGEQDNEDEDPLAPGTAQVGVSPDLQSQVPNPTGAPSLGELLGANLPNGGSFPGTNFGGQ